MVIKIEERRGRIIIAIGRGDNIRRFEWTVEPRYWRNPLISTILWLVIPLIFYIIGLYAFITSFIFANIIAMITIAYALRIIGTGRLDLGPHFFVALGGYAAAIASRYWGLTPFASLVIALAIGLIIGATLSVITIISRGVYFALITFILPFVLREIVYWRSDIFGAETGIPDIPPLISGYHPALNDLLYFYMSALFVLLYLFIVDKILRSRYGLIMGVINEDEDIAENYGINTKRMKIITYTLTSGMISVAGWLIAHYYTSFTGTLYLGLEFLTLIFMASVIGGKGAVYGALIGSYFVVALREVYRISLGVWSSLALYITLLSLFIALPEGLWGLYRKRRYREYVPTIKVRRKL